MYTLKDTGVIQEIECGNNFGYVFQDNNSFVSTDYKVLQSQTNGIFVQCMKMMYNGKIQMYYITDDYRPISAVFAEINLDMLINIVINVFESIAEVRNNGFLSSQNIDISKDKIFVDSATLKVKLVYLPINRKVFNSYAEFQSELRSRFIKLINEVVINSNVRLEKFLLDLANGSMSIEDIYNKYKGVGIPPLQTPKNGMGNMGDINNENMPLKLVAINAPKYFEVILDREKIVLGKKQEIVDVAITFNKMISRKHCSIIRSNGNYYISDEDSLNGTYVNKVKIAPYQMTIIKRGDTIRMADSDFQIV